jgi:uncharacterized protein (DUF2237 family)
VGNAKNVLGTELQTCGTDPMTGFFRDGCCNTDANDFGMHLVCAVMTDSFLQFSKAAGNDLTTPMPAYQFPGLVEGDHWCLCVQRWQEALKANVAPKVNLAATHISALEFVDLEDLQEHSIGQDV